MTFNSHVVGVRYFMGFVCALLVLPAIAANSVLEEIVVTAQKRDQSLQDVPLSVRAITAEFMEDHGIDEIEELGNIDPSFQYKPTFSARDTTLEIRGIGTNGQNAGIDSSVGLYLDEVFIPRPSGLIGSLVDIQQVEILKGPQGTLYGANTPAGLLNVRTMAPTQEFEARIRGGVGEFNMRELSGFVSGGITDSVAARISMWAHDDDGYVRLMNGGTGNGRSDWGTRAKARWDMNDSTTLEVIADYSSVDSYCCYAEWIDISSAALAGFDSIAARLNLNRDEIFPSRGNNEGFEGRGEALDHVSFADGDAHEQFEQTGLSVKLEKRFASGMTLSAIAAHRSWNSSQIADVDVQGVNLGLLDPQDEDQDTNSLEVRISSSVGEFVEYLAGVYYYTQDSFFQQATSFQLPLCMVTPTADARVASGAIPDTVEGRSRCAGAARRDQWTQEATSAALFADVTINLSDTLRVSVGGRVTRDDKDGRLDNRLFDAESAQIVTDFGLNCVGCEFGVSDARINGFGVLFAGVDFVEQVDNTQTTWSTTLSYDLSDRVMSYLRVATGYKAPGINGRPIRTPSIPRVFREETSTNYEAGVKTLLWENRLRLNAAIYFNEFKDLQQLAANTTTDLGVSGTFVKNAGVLEHTGVEMDYAAQVNEMLLLSGSVAYLDSEFAEFDGAPCATPASLADVPISAAAGPGICDQTGFPAPRTPELRFNQTVRLTFPLDRADLDWWVQGSVIYTDEQYLNADRDRRSLQDSYTLMDLSAGLSSRSGTWNARIYVKNVTDEMYLVSVLGGPSLASFEGLGGASAVGYFGAPRTIGASFSVNF